MAQQKKSAKPLPLLHGLIASSAAVTGATILTHPIDVVKVRFQVAKDGKASDAAFSVRRFVSFWPHLYKQEGTKAFTAGMPSAIVRAAVAGGLRMGLIQPFEAVLGSKAKASASAGVAAAVFGHPLELLKVRMQSHAEEAKQGELRVLIKLLRSSGIGALFRGFQWGALRQAILTSSQVVPYAAAKEVLLHRLHFRDGILCHLLASLAAGVVTSTATSPVDVLKTRVMAARSADGRKASEIISAMVKSEGLFVFFRGWMANYVRLGPQTLFILVFHEQCTRLVRFLPGSDA